MDLNLSRISSATHEALEVSGEVDVHTAPQLRDRVFEMIDDGAKVVVVDLNKVAFIDSTGLGALVAAVNQAKERGVRLALACSLERVLKLFRITGLDSVFVIHPTVEAAAAALTSEVP